MQQSTRLTAKAFSLIESAIVLGIAGLIIGGLWVAAAAVRENLIVSRSAAAIIQLSTGAQNLFGKSAEYPSIAWGSLGGHLDISSTVISAGLIPRDLTINNNTIKILPGTSWTIYLTGPTSFAPNTIAIIGFSNSAAAASKLINSVVASSKGELLYADCWDNVSIGTRQSWSINSGTGPTSAPLICVSGPGGTIMGFYFRPKIIP